MVDFPPLLPSLLWWQTWLKALLSGESHTEAIITANGTVRNSKEFGRLNLESPDGPPVSLSVAIEGGGRQIRSFQNLPSLSLSEHGDWRKVHLGAFDAHLGRSPFYRYFRENLQEVYRDTSLQKLRDFNLAIFRVIATFLMQNITIGEIKETLETSAWQSGGRERGREILQSLRPDISITEPLAIYGKEILPALLSDFP